MEGLRTFDDAQCMSFDALLELGREHAEANPTLWETEIDAAHPEDLMILTYTSGTTGPPKGAMISQRNMLYMMGNLQRVYGIFDSDEQLGFLPLAHVAGPHVLHVLGDRVALGRQPGRVARDRGARPAGDRADHSFLPYQGCGRSSTPPWRSS